MRRIVRRLGPSALLNVAKGVTKLAYTGHRVMAGKPRLPDMPTTFASEGEASTLIVHMEDKVAGLQADLFYTIYHHANVLIRSASFTNKGSKQLSLVKAASISIDFSPSDYEMLTLQGDWAFETVAHRRPVHHGLQSIQSRTGFSSAQASPFLALLHPDATEAHGDAYGFSLMWAGSHLVEVERTTFGLTRVALGTNPDEFEWPLCPGSQTFSTPECIAVFSSEGLSGMSYSFHAFLRKHVSASAWQDRIRPTVLNSWEGVYFDFTADRIVELAKAARPLGVETLVLDDGWFGRKYPRDSDKQGLGDWVVNERKLPGGLSSLSERVNATGLQFG